MDRNLPAHLGEVVIAQQVITAQRDPRRTRQIIVLLVSSVALLMTGLGIVMPIFARRLGEFGAGVEALGWMTMAYALAQLLWAPFMGSLADRIGRRPLMLVALAAFAGMNIAYLLATSVKAYILIRALGGTLTAGLFPTTMSMIADLVSEEQRARWIGMVMGGYGVGAIFGPAFGGVLYDTSGFAAPFMLSAGLAALAFVAATILVPETRPAAVRRRLRLRARRMAALHGQPRSPWLLLPAPVTLVGTLLFLDFIGTFAFTFIEPQMVFYVYEVLHWTTVQFGVVVGAYGLAMVLAQFMLGQVSDRMGRKPVIVAGLFFNVTLYAGMTWLTNFAIITLVALIAGLGAALLAPASSALYLDLTPETERARMMGLKESALGLGGVLGPLLVVFASRYWAAHGIFMIAGCLVLGSAVLALLLLREPHEHTPQPGDRVWRVSAQRALEAHAALQGIVLRASAVRAERLI